MANQTKTTSGNNTVYVVTDQNGNSVTATQIATPGMEKVVSFSSSGNLQYDGQQMLAQLLLLLATGLTP